MKKITTYIYEGLFDIFKKKVKTQDQQPQPKEEPIKTEKELTNIPQEQDKEETIEVENPKEKENIKDEESTKSNENSLDVNYHDIDCFTKEEFDKRPTFEVNIAGISYNMNPTFSYTWGIIYHEEDNEYDSNAWVIMHNDKTKLGYISKDDKRKFLNWSLKHKRIPYFGIIYKFVDNIGEIKVAGDITCYRTHEEENGQEDWNKLLLKLFNIYQSRMSKRENEFEQTLKDNENKGNELKEKYKEIGLRSFVTGTYYAPGSKLIKYENFKRQAFLVWMKNNEYDKNAIAVCIINEKAIRIGWVSKDDSVFKQICMLFFNYGFDYIPCCLEGIIHNDWAKEHEDKCGWNSPGNTSLTVEFFIDINTFKNSNENANKLIEKCLTIASNNKSNLYKNLIETDDKIKYVIDTDNFDKISNDVDKLL